MGARAEWQPPARPDAHAILREAQQDALAGRHQDALDKHVWFHRNALKHRPSLYGVRLSFALGFWTDLGRRYPPALAALKAERDAAAARIRAGKGERGDFHDVASINSSLAEDAATAELFAWLDANDPALARTSYNIAERALVQAKRYALAGKYLEPKPSTDRMLDMYRRHMQMAKQPDFRGSDLEEFGRRSLASSAATLVALLVQNGRAEDADAVSAAVLKEWPDDGLRRELAQAKKGVVPAPWPR